METGSSTPRYSGLIELADEQLEPVVGGGGKPGIATGGSTAGLALSATFPNGGPGGGPAPDPDGGKGGISGTNG
jgi:hypothetical protein